jgi:hypothetical protein
MASWRDSTSQQAQDDLDALVSVTLPFAQEMLDKRGEYLPFGAAITLDGETRMLAGDPGAGERPESTEVLGTLVEGVLRQQAELRAVAFVADVRTADSDAVRVELEHREGQAISVLLPYRKKHLGRGVEYSDLRAGTSNPKVWTGP